MQITVHTKRYKKRFQQEYTGFIRVTDGDMSYTVGTGIIRLNEADALHDAAWLSEEYTPTHPFH